MIETMILLFTVQMPENWSWALASQGTVIAEFVGLHSTCLSQHIPCGKKHQWLCHKQASCSLVWLGWEKNEKVHILNIHCLKMYVVADKLSEVLSAL